MRISDWSSDVCSSDLPSPAGGRGAGEAKRRVAQEKAGSMAGFLLLLRRALFLQRLLRFLLLFLLLVQVLGHDGLRWLGGRRRANVRRRGAAARSEEHTSELQSLMRISYAAFCLKKKNEN